MPAFKRDRIQAENGVWKKYTLPRLFFCIFTYLAGGFEVGELCDCFASKIFRY